MKTSLEKERNVSLFIRGPCSLFQDRNSRTLEEKNQKEIGKRYACVIKHGCLSHLKNVISVSKL